MADNPESDKLHRFEQLVGNVMSMRSELFRQLFDPRRDLDDECGYPRSNGGLGIGSINPELYRSLYEREAIAARVVQVMPKESWQVTPSVYEDESSDTVTEFEERWDGLSQSLRGEQSWYQDEQGSPVWEALKRADILSGIGHFGVLLIGLDDGLPLDQPADGVVSLKPATNRLGQHITANRSIPTKPLPDPKTVSKEEYAAARNEAAVSSFAGVQGTDAQYLGTQFGPPEYPATKRASKEHKLLFLRSFDESLVQVVQYEANVRNPRFGQPVMYLVTLNDPREQHSGVGLPMATVRVHWSRVIHLADNLGSSEIFGVPRMRPVLNRLLDLRKLYGGSAEMYWRGAFPGLSFETHPQLGGDVLLDKQGLRDEFENYSNGLQRALFLMGMSAKTLAPTVVDPSAQIEVQIEAVCIQLGIPVRVFKGSERGELASSQDDASWNDRLRERQHGYITPRIIVPFVDRLISMGILPEPGASSKLKDGNSSKPLNPLRNRLRLVRNADGSTTITMGGYSIEWPDLDSLSDVDKAGIGLTKTQALAAYVGGNCETVVPPQQYLTGFLGMDDEEATSTLEDAEQQHAQDLEEQQQLADEQGFEPVPPPGFQAPAPEVPPGAPPGKGGPPQARTQPKAAGAGGKPPKPPAVANATAELDEPTDNDWVTLDHGQHVYISQGGDFLPGGPRGTREKASQAQRDKGQDPLPAGFHGEKDEKTDKDTNALVEGGEWARGKGIDLAGHAQKSIEKGHSTEEFLAKFRNGKPEDMQKIGAFYDAYKKRQEAKKPTANYDPEQPRGSDGKWGGDEGAERMPPDEGWDNHSTKDIAGILHGAVHHASGGDLEATCTAANAALSKIFPKAERYQGTYDGEDHEWAKVEGHYVDVTAGQFGGPKVMVSRSLPPEYEGSRTDWSKLGPVEQKLSDKILEHAMQARDRKPTANYDPEQPRDDKGRFGSGGGAASKSGDGGKGPLGKTLGALKAAGAAVGHLEHVAKVYATDKIDRAVSKLPERGQKAVRASFAVLRAGSAVAFASWTATQALAERVAKERGRTDEEARSLRGTLATADLLTFKPASLAMGATGIGAVGIGVAGLLPPATAGYLAYSTAKDPMATYRAAKGLIKDMIPKQVLRDNMATNASYGLVQTVDDALKAHDYSDWYVALLHAAIEETGDVQRAVKVADAAFAKSPVDSSTPQDDDESVVFGKAEDTEES